MENEEHKSRRMDRCQLVKASLSALCSSSEDGRDQEHRAILVAGIEDIWSEVRSDTAKSLQNAVEPVAGKSLFPQKIAI